MGNRVNVSVTPVTVDGVFYFAASGSYKLSFEPASGSPAYIGFYLVNGSDDPVTGIHVPRSASGMPSSISTSVYLSAGYYLIKVNSETPSRASGSFTVYNVERFYD